MRKYISSAGGKYWKKEADKNFGAPEGLNVGRKNDKMFPNPVGVQQLLSGEQKVQECDATKMIRELKLGKQKF